MRTANWMLAAGALALVSACSKTDDGAIIVKQPVGIETKTDTLHGPTFTTKTDTVNTPVLGTQKETVVVNKPVVGMKKSVVKVPVVKNP